VLRVFHHRDSVHSTNEEVYAAVSAVLGTYPDIGREKMLAAVKGQGVSATCRQVEATLLTLRGPSGSGMRKPIQRRVYTVPGSNYLWHHDGQHGVFLYVIVSFFRSHAGLGLIRWKLVIHAFADGHARFIVGIQVNPNNRAVTVFNLFLRATAEHGTPCHVRGDHVSARKIWSQNSFIFIKSHHSFTSFSLSYALTIDSYDSSYAFPFTHDFRTGKAILLVYERQDRYWYKRVKNAY